MRIVFSNLKKPFLSADMKLILVVFIVLTMGFFSFDYVIYVHGSENRINEAEFYAQDFNITPTIFLLGSSQIIQLDPYYFEEQLLKNNFQFSVYNLAKASDQPHNRILDLDKIISAKPDLVIYGIDYRNLDQHTHNVKISGDEKLKSKSILPDVNYEISYKLKSISFFNDNFEPHKSPKFNTFHLLQKIVDHIVNDEYITSQETFSPKTPFFIDDPYNEVLTEKQLHDLVVSNTVNKINETDDHVQDIIKIINVLHSNNIKVVIFSTPAQHDYLDKISEKDQKTFISKLNNLGNDLDVPVYHSFENFKDLEIWSDLIHITTSKQENRYNELVVDFILKSL